MKRQVIYIVNQFLCAFIAMNYAMSTYTVTRVVFLWLSFLVVVGTGRTMQAKEILDALGHKELNSYFASHFNEISGQTLHDMMYAGQTVNQWIRGSKETGVFLAKFRRIGTRTALDNAIGHFNATSPLYDWLMSLGNTTDAYSNIIPERIRVAYGDNIEHIQRRAIEAVRLLERNDVLCLQNVLTKNIKLPSEQLKLNGTNIRARLGPDSLDAAIFLADLILMYFKQTGVLEHGTQYKTVNTAQEFGQALNEELHEKTKPDQDLQVYWAHVSLLTGWEIIRRYVNNDNVEEIRARPEHDPASIVESGLRLVNNEKIKNPNFLIMVALALLH